VIPVDIKGSVEFNIKDELRLSGSSKTDLTIDVKFEEELTGRVQNTSTEISIHKFSTKIQIKKLAEKFKPGLIFPFQVIVLHHDGAPVLDENNKLEVEIEFGKKNLTSYYLDKNGMVEIDADIPENADKMEIKVNFIKNSIIASQ
jgi:CD109 antigen